jgi:hypothetical protein
MDEPAPVPDAPALSRRAARRLIQRAFVLTGRDRKVRQHIREARLTLLWVLEDWGFAWTVLLERGGLVFDRRPAKRPDVTFTWQTAREFFSQAEQGRLVERDPSSHEGFRYEGPPESKRALEPLWRAFAAALGEVLKNPVDENGDPLV